MQWATQKADMPVVGAGIVEVGSGDYFLCDAYQLPIVVRVEQTPAHIFAPLRNVQVPTASAGGVQCHATRKR